ncbi:aminomethyl-transferring glycine dehydrogenase subunit GcvPA [Methylocapsa sp. D3K7]|uniref:aminomethyl-transferring glycine dehydrogenase subunit GcvPA n=1 Tax=Methylocapsa sp. D3K7 TaxID=3041435 RepID=UPI00244EFAB2|nr:aminomethyl-transferring glycine dehydrogenase subunit GcvPA [Methylocapsa sp. D3K7]WGJ14884.1 aminomethyl-transferring glycine dehydrogenase subunit GcvPA [Methylocapsa sp. D3K7]
MRYLPLNAKDRAEMLARVGVASIDTFFADIPAHKRLDHDLDLPARKTEMDVERLLSGLAAKNVAAGLVPFFVGAGAYKHHVPASVDHLIQRSEFLTSYTPYQPEIAQGTLQTIFEFQTQVAALTAMDVANASMYDGSTATVEAVAMARRITGRSKAILSGGLHPHYAEAVRTVSTMAGEETEVLAPDIFAAEDLFSLIDADTSCVVVQNPDFFGNLRDLSAIAAACKTKGALLVGAFTEAVSLGLVQPPGAMGADIVAGEGQSIGNRLNFGGPYVGLFATKTKYLRQMPGRLCGQTVDASGRRGFVLTLSTREQHIRRDKATSNICTNSGLASLAFSIHLTLLGETGLRRLARINHAHAVNLADRLAAVPGVQVLNKTFFNEFTLRILGNAAQAIERMAEMGVLGGVPVSRLLPGRGLDDLILAASTETNTDADREAFADALQGALSC